MIEFKNRRKMFDNLIEQSGGSINIGEVKYRTDTPARVKVIKFTCPCCGYPTLTERKGFEMCIICGWEDEGQDDKNLNEIRSPNGISLLEGRKNFEKTFDSNIAANVDSKKTKENYLSIKKELISSFEELYKNSKDKIIIKKINKLFNQYEVTLKQSIKIFENKINS